MSELERATLDNGLRVVLAPDHVTPLVAIAVLYDVGSRSEPAGRTGFAHLFEHLMFQGSENLEKLAHIRYVQGSGGTFNATTHLDCTKYFEVLPSNALERGLFLEADRMRAPRITPENLANQIVVVKQEIQHNVLNRPYGGFPRLSLPPILFDTFPNAHNGYGDFVDLDSATCDDASEFFARYYAPANSVLCVVGDLDVGEALAMVERHFGGIPSRAAPHRASFAEPDLTAERRAHAIDPHAPTPATSAAWRVPDPIAALSEYLPYVVLARLLAGDPVSRLRQRLLQRERIATKLAAYVGFTGDPFGVRDPTALIFEARHPRTVPGDDVLAAVDDELGILTKKGLGDAELRRVASRVAVHMLREVDSPLKRAVNLGTLELQHERAELLWELPAMISAVTEEQVRAAAASLRPDRRAVFELRPGAA